MSRTRPIHRVSSGPMAVTTVLALMLVSVGASAASPRQAAASPPGADGLPPYDSLDTDKDGIVTLPEVIVRSPSLAARIAHCDTNGDKRLSKEEYAACHPRPAAQSKAAASASH